MTPPVSSVTTPERRSRFREGPRRRLSGGTRECAREHDPERRQGRGCPRYRSIDDAQASAASNAQPPRDGLRQIDKISGRRRQRQLQESGGGGGGRGRTTRAAPRRGRAQSDRSGECPMSDGIHARRAPKLTPYLTPYGAHTDAIPGRGWIRNSRILSGRRRSGRIRTRLDGPNRIRNQQVSGSSPLAGSNIINNLQGLGG